MNTQTEVPLSQSWHKQDFDTAEGTQSMVVVSYKLHQPSCWRLDATARAQVIDSEVARELLRFVEDHLDLVTDEDGRVFRADLEFQVGPEQASRARRLIERVRIYVSDFRGKDIPQELEEYILTARDIKRDKNTKELTGVTLTFALDNPKTEGILATLQNQGLKVKQSDFTNSFRLTACREDDSRNPGQFWVAANLAIRHSPDEPLSQIAKTQGLQQLLVGFIKLPAFDRVPPETLPGIGQEVAQQVMSFIGQIDSRRVKWEVNFPTVESRDPTERLADYRRALDVLTADWRPLERHLARELDPSIPAGDPRGNRIVYTDKRWLAVARGVKAKPLTLFFVKGNSVRIFRGTAQFSTNIPKSGVHARQGRQDRRGRAINFYRPWETPRAAALAGKPLVTMRHYYAAIPLDTQDEEIQESFCHRGEGDTGRGLHLDFEPIPLHHDSLTKPWRRVKPTDLLVPLECNRDWSQKILESTRYEIAWSRLVHREEDWYLQLTLRVPLPQLAETRQILGLSWGLDGFAYWTLVNLEGQVLEQGRFENPQAQKFFHRKERLERDQKRQRWIGGRKFVPELKLATHRLVNQILKLARVKSATLAVEDITFRPAAGPESATNFLFTIWNSGQLRRFCEYKAGFAGVKWEKPYNPSFTCPIDRTVNDPKAKPEDRPVYWEHGMLHCRKCGYEGVPTGAEKARLVALVALDRQKRRRKLRKNPKEG